MTQRRAGQKGAAFGTGGGTSGGSRRGGHRGPLSDEDVRLWEMMKQRLEPLRKPKSRVTSHPIDPGDGVSGAFPPSPWTGKAGKVPPKPSEPAARAKPAATVKAPAAPPPPAIIEKRKSRQLAKGQRAIEAVLDLHGMRQREAHAALRHFLAGAHANGAKFVKVITGKGAAPGSDERRTQPFDAPFDPDGGERGVLKRLVPEWLREADLRRLVVGFSSAGRGHGGEGALYIELRRKSRTQE